MIRDRGNAFIAPATIVLSSKLHERKLLLLSLYPTTHFLKTIMYFCYQILFEISRTFPPFLTKHSPNYSSLAYPFPATSSISSESDAPTVSEQPLVPSLYPCRYPFATVSLIIPAHRPGAGVVNGPLAPLTPGSNLPWQGQKIHHAA